MIDHTDQKIPAQKIIAHIDTRRELSAEQREALQHKVRFLIVNYGLTNLIVSPENDRIAAARALVATLEREELS